MWGLVGPKGHGSWFNVQREKDWFPRWLGGMKAREKWGDLAKESEGISKKAVTRGRRAAREGRARMGSQAGRPIKGDKVRFAAPLDKYRALTSSGRDL